MLWIILLIIGICFLGLIFQFWLVILSTVIGGTFWGTTGGIIGFLVGCFLQATQEKKFVRSRRRHDNYYTHSNQVPYNITRLKPIIELVSYYTTFPDQTWSTDKVSYVKNVFQAECKDATDLRLLKNLLKERSVDLSQILRGVLSIASDYETRITIFKMCCQGLNYNDYNDRDMERILTNLAMHLQLHAFHYQTIINMFKSHYEDNSNYRNEESNTTSLSDAYRILDLSETNDQSAVIKAYRKKMMQYHPDKHPNASDLEKEKLNEKVSEIQKAKERILKALS